jgi:hypothetical protein
LIFNHEFFALGVYGRLYMTASDCSQHRILDGLQFLQRCSTDVWIVKGAGIVNERLLQSFVGEEEGFFGLTPERTREGLYDLVPTRQPGFEIIGR